MNVVHPPTWKVVESVAFVALAIALPLVDCKPTVPADEPPVIFVDASDAAALLDAGPHPSVCGQMCASWAAAGCRAATPNCIVVCQRETRADGFYSPMLVRCVIDAAGERAKLHDCNDRACP